MKYTDAAVVFTVMSSAGLLICFRLKKRKKLLESTVMMLEYIRMQLEYAAMPIYEILNGLDRERFSDRLFIGECRSSIESGADFPTAWRESVCASKLYTDEERLNLLQLGSLLGTSDLNGQLALVESFADRFKLFRDKAAQSSDKYAGTSVFIGFFCGFGFFVLMV